MAEHRFIGPHICCPVCVSLQAKLTPAAGGLLSHPATQRKIKSLQLCLFPAIPYRSRLKCARDDSQENLKAMNMAGDKPCRSWTEQSFGNLRGCPMCPRKVSLKADPDTLSGEERATSHPSKSSKPNLACNNDRSHGTWPLKSLVRLILCLDTISCTTRPWLSRETAVARRSGIIYLKIDHS